MQMVPTRDGFGRGVVELGKTDERVVVLSADLTDSTRAGWFKKELPERFFAFGVSEQDMFGVASGFALAGKIPYACTFGVFATGRVWDQIRVSIAYMNLNVKIIGTHGGISVGEDGATHQALEEITLMRVLPNMTVIVPADAVEAKKATIEAAKHNGPVYIRLGRSEVPVITKESDRFEIGKANVLKEGNDLAIFACGMMVYYALEASEILSKEGIKARVINLHTPKPIDADTVKKAAIETKAIVTVEEHTLSGGFGSAISEIVSQNCPVPMKMIGINDRFGESGSQEELLKKFNLETKDIVKAAKEVLKVKK
ncbi:MAG: transketolase [Candidatus Omnitrophica bacterium CG07_land_8_20_14_0_80_42_15]|uniref:Transketolase n=1 Tax=Candidatus Aquitaenariimonas noxiae TaxID=1974741 RepID=A0A2J0L0U2_9BACT|nr:MAG: transketolase [Candidatus Omnitrophica bacterium CG07_land_8_20_14_0_80_42_15]